MRALSFEANSANVSTTTAAVPAEILIKVSLQIEITFAQVPIATTFSDATKAAVTDTVPRWRRAAKLSRIAIDESEIAQFSEQLDSILSFVDQLSEVNVDGVEPMTSVTPMAMRQRKDEVTDGNDPEAVLANAPRSEDGFFLVPKVIE